MNALLDPDRLGRHFIAGAYEPQHEGYELDVHDPSTGEILCVVPRGSKRDVERAVAAARAASPSWQLTSADERRRGVEQGAALLVTEDLALLDAVDAGVPLAFARERAARLAVEVRAAMVAESSVDGMLARPLGVVAWISGGTGAFEGACGVAAALVSGNAVIWKPSSRAPLVAAKIATALGAALPPGVLNLVHGIGADAGARLAAHPGVDGIFGSVRAETARALRRAAIADERACALRVCGRGLLVVDGRADVDAVAAAAVAGLRRHAGQDGPLAHILVGEENRRRMVDALVDRLAALSLDRASQPGCGLGPLLDELRAVHFLDDVARAARIVLAPRRRSETGRGYHVSPAVVEDTQEFVTAGPAVCVTAFATAAALEELLSRPARRVQIWTDDLARARKLARGCRADAIAFAPDDPRLPLPAADAYRHWSHLAGKEAGHERQSQS
jgi:acyl-CoA reductase-like NAD-dependent aldehyde dehydrogenase